MTFANARGTVQINLVAGTVTGAYGNETVSGIQKIIGSSAGGDSLCGTTSTTLLQGLAGNLIFDGGGASNITITGAVHARPTEGVGSVLAGDGLYRTDHHLAIKQG